MKRQDFQQLAVIRLKEAKALLDAGFPDGAYYLAGYSVECGLKACIARRTERFEFPDKSRVLASYDHDISKLLKTASLDKVVSEIVQPSKLAANWKIVQKWNVESRYERRARPDAEDLINAVQDRKDGVLRWLKHRW